jgi:tetratricopeptide (TPR) repeat protein
MHVPSRSGAWSHGLATGLAGLILLLPCARAQQNTYSPPPGADDTEKAKDEKDQPERKHAGWFTHPARPTPAEQLAYAQSLEAAGRLRAAAGEYDALVHKWHESPEATTAQMSYASMLEKRRKYVGAFNEYQYLIEQFAGRFAFEEVLERQYQIATHVQTVRHGTFGFLQGYTTPTRAIPLFEKLALNAPHWARSAEVQFTLGQLYEQDGEFELASQAYETTLTDHSESPYAPRGAFGRANAMYKLSNANPRDEMGCRQALSAFSVFLRDYPNDEHAEEAQTGRDEMKARLARMYYDRAVFYDKLAHKPEAALINYSEFIKQFPTSPQAEAVTRRMQELEAARPPEKQAP